MRTNHMLHTIYMVLIIYILQFVAYYYYTGKKGPWFESFNNEDFVSNFKSIYAGLNTFT